MKANNYAKPVLVQGEKTVLAKIFPFNDRDPTQANKAIRAAREASTIGEVVIYREYRDQPRNVQLMGWC